MIILSWLRRLNPCFNGIWSATEGATPTDIALAVRCLNPCFNGIWSATEFCNNPEEIVPEVLILVLMEYGLRQFYHLAVCSTAEKVLILVLMEYGLRHVNL